MKIINLASGSKGNATIVMTASTKLLIDAGISYKQMVLRSNGLIDDVSSVLITHEHIDHVLGLPVFSKKQPLNIYTHEKTWTKLRDKVVFESINYVNSYVPFTIGDITVTPIELFHDAVAPLGFVFESGDKKLVYITDTGYVHRNSYRYINNANMYFLESNHDIEMLMNSDRRHDLKVRIYGDKGHLSNIDAAALLCYVSGDRTKKVIFSHISDECNTNKVIETSALDVFKTFGMCLEKFQVFYASAENSLEVEVE